MGINVSLDMFKSRTLIILLPLLLIMRKMKYDEHRMFFIILLSIDFSQINSTHIYRLKQEEEEEKENLHD